MYPIKSIFKLLWYHSNLMIIIFILYFFIWAEHPNLDSQPLKNNLNITVSFVYKTWISFSSKIWIFSKIYYNILLKFKFHIEKIFLHFFSQKTEAKKCSILVCIEIWAPLYVSDINFNGRKNIGNIPHAFECTVIQGNY